MTIGMDTQTAAESLSRTQPDALPTLKITECTVASDGTYSLTLETPEGAEQILDLSVHFCRVDAVNLEVDRVVLQHAMAWTGPAMAWGDAQRWLRANREAVDSALLEAREESVKWSRW